MVLPVSRRVPRVPRYLGTRRGSRTSFAYGARTLYRRPFQVVRLEARFVTPRRLRDDAMSSPATPSIQCPRACTYRRFRLFPFRSPLLGESRLLSLPPGTEMVHFPGFASVAYEFSDRSPGFTWRGCPIRKSPDRRLFAPTRSLSQLATSFIASRHQGIHRMPLVA